VVPDLQSPRTLLYGFFARQRTDPPQRPCSSGVPASPSCLRPLPSPTHSSRRVCGHAAFTALQVLFSGPTTDRASRPISLARIGLLTPAPAGDPASPFEGTPCSCVPCRPRPPWCEGRMDTAFVALLPTRPGPLFGRLVHPWGRPHRFRPGASPQALRIPPRGGHPALPGRGDQGQRGITPTFGYGTLHPGARRTSTSRSTPLPGAQYGPVRLPLLVHRWLAVTDLPTAAHGADASGQTGDLPVLAHGGSAHAWGLRPRRVGAVLALAHGPIWPSAQHNGVGTLVAPVFAAQYPASACPCQRFACSLTGTGA